jgi:predicted metal-dependent HD superfamily phosphohydrolase
MAGRSVYISRWNRLWSTLGAAHADETLFCDIIAKYSEPHRKYHTLRHLEECLRHLDEVQHLASRPAEIELALWFHDAIYDVRRQDNEARSAEWARASAEAASLPAKVCDRVQHLVLVTRHNAAPESTDEAILVDIDLSILGASPQRFDEYETTIREEYNWVPRLVFDFKRRSILNEFRRRSPVFHTAYFAKRFERQARKNLERSLRKH